MKKVFCEECLNEESYHIIEEEKTETVNGNEIVYSVKSALCNNCNTELYVDEIMNDNIISYQDMIREETGIIKVSEIKQLLKKYDIGAKPLAKLLRWGEVNIIRYLNGAIPDRIYSDKLKELLYDESKMENLLYQNKKFISNTAYRKCKGTLQKLKFSNNESKLYMTANLIIGFNPDITNLALQKLLYFVQGFSCAILHKPIFRDMPEAWSLGPVYPDIYHRYASYQYNPIEFDMEEFDIDNISIFTTEEINYIFRIVQLFGEYSGSTLANMSHLTTPWEKHKFKNNEKITLDELKSYFDKVVRQYDISIGQEKNIEKYIADIKKR